MSGPDRSQYDSLPIPTYEEAINSRPTSRTGPEEVSDDAERQGLLRRLAGDAYHPPTVESARESLDSLDGIDTPTSPAQRRREMEQMDIEDPLNADSPHRSLLRQRFAKNFSWTSSFSSLTLPSFRSWMPTFSFPRISYESIDSHRAIIIGRLFGIFVILGVVYALIATDILAFGRNRLNMGPMYDPEALRAFVQKHVNNQNMIQEYLGHITEFPHLAGTEGSYVLGEWIQEIFKTAELEEVNMERFDVYMNYPRSIGRKLAIVEGTDSGWEATIEEENEETAVFHGHSAAGDVKGPLIYANYGSRDDFAKLKDEGIDVRGAVVLMRYYGTQGDAGLKVKAAEMAGAVGAVLFSAPADIGYMMGPTFPEGRFLPEDGVQRASVGMQSFVVGDMLSPGWASTPGEKNRLDKKKSTGLNTIPSLPISWNDAQHLLLSIRALGKQIPDWKGDSRTDFWTGSKNSPVVNLRNEQDEETRQGIYNVLGKITGWEQPEKKIIVGSHRDAWCLGAGESGTGTAIMLDVIRIFGELRHLNWRPLRTIEFASWDSAAFNLEGSTEHVENRIDELRQDGISYVNLDAAITGTNFTVQGSSILRRPIFEAANRVGDPSTHDENTKTVKEVWDGVGNKLRTPAGHRDTLPFHSFAGMSALDISFSSEDPYAFGSCYDRYESIATTDNGFRYHRVLGEIFALIILELSDRPMLPFDIQAFSDELRALANTVAPYAEDHNVHGLDMTPLTDSIALVATAAKEVNELEEMWTRHVFNHGGFEGHRHSLMRLNHNDRLAKFEKGLLDLSDGGGLKDRKQYKHTVFAPQKWDSTKGAVFPGVIDAIDEGDQKEAQFQIQVVADKLRDAAAGLRQPPGERPDDGQ